MKKMCAVGAEVQGVRTDSTAKDGKNRSAGRGCGMITGATKNPPFDGRVFLYS